MLDLIEKPLDQVVPLVDVLVVGDDLRTRASRWNERFVAHVRDAGTKPVGVIALVGQQFFEPDAADQLVFLAWNKMFNSPPLWPFNFRRIKIALPSWDPESEAHSRVRGKWR
jgi:hypothetical protein